MEEIESPHIRWCEGLKSIGVRKLSLDEAEELRLLVRAAFFRLWVPLAIAISSPLALLVSFLVHGEAQEPPLHRMIPMFILMFLGGAILPAASVLVARDIVKRWRLLRRDLKESTVEQFVATQELNDENKSNDSNGYPESLEVLPNSLSVFSVDGSRPSSNIEVKVYESSPSPDSITSYGITAEVEAVIPPEVIQCSDIERRRLSGPELEELKKHIKEAQKPSRTTIGTIAYGGLAVIAGILYRDAFSAWLEEYKFPLAFLIGLILVSVYQFIQNLRYSRAFEADYESGWVLVVKEKEPEHGCYERLSESGVIWSIEGVPAGWRLTNAGKYQQSAADGRRD